MKLLDKDGAFVAENAAVLGRVTLGPGSSVWYGVTIRADLDTITIGSHTNVQDGCVLHCDPDKPLSIGDYVTIGHQAMVHGRSIGDRCLIGIGSIILSGAVIGEGSLVAAGALVREDQVIPPRSLVVGIPCRVIGKTTGHQFLRRNVNTINGFTEHVLRV